MKADGDFAVECRDDTCLIIPANDSFDWVSRLHDPSVSLSFKEIAFGPGAQAYATMEVPELEAGKRYLFRVNSDIHALPEVRKCLHLPYVQPQRVSIRLQMGTGRIEAIFVATPDNPVLIACIRPSIEQVLAQQDVPAQAFTLPDWTIDLSAEAN